MLIGSGPETACADALSNRGSEEDAHGDLAIELDDTVYLPGCHPHARAVIRRPIARVRPWTAMALTLRNRDS